MELRIGVAPGSRWQAGHCGFDPGRHPDAHLNVGNSRAFVGAAERYKMRVFLDKRVIEVYVNDGVAAVYNPIDAGQHDLGIAVFGQPGAGRGAGGVPPRLESLKIWPLKGARFSMEHFHL